MEIILIFLIIQVGLTIITIAIAMNCTRKRNNKLGDGPPKCRCTDVTQCDVWCIAKENFTKYHQ